MSDSKSASRSPAPQRGRNSFVTKFWQSVVGNPPRNARSKPRRTFRIETLEDRCLLAAASIYHTLSPDLVQLMQSTSFGVAEASTQTQDGGTTLSPLSMATVINGQVVIDAVALGAMEALTTDIVSLGGTVTATAGRIASALVPIDSLDELASMASLAFARSVVSTSNLGVTTSQGHQSMRTDEISAFIGLNGAGQKVGVMSDSFDTGPGSYAADILSGDLPGAGNPDGFTTPVQIVAEGGTGSDEGRAMAQLVYDVAPGASLAFATAFGGQASFAANIAALVAAGSTVIVDDVINFAEPMFQDGVVAQAVDAAIAAGVPYYSSAGNQARDSYQAPFNNSGVNLGSDGTNVIASQTTFIAHDFDPGPGVDLLQDVTIFGGDTFLTFQWADPFFSVSNNGAGPGAVTDLDLAIFQNGVFIDFFGANSGNVGGDPLEILGLSAGGSTTIQIAIGKFEGPDPSLIKYVGFGAINNILDFPTNSSTSFGHNNAAGASAVAAAPFFNTPEFGVSPATLESFSSRGGTPILFDLAGAAVGAPGVGITRQTPDVTGPDGTNTTFFGSDSAADADAFPNFFGTSAAAPHVAALAALIKQANPGATPAQVNAALESTASDMGAAGYDVDSGFGYVNGVRALTNLAGPFDVTFDGTAGDDTMRIVRNGSETEFYLGGALQFSMLTSDISSIAVNGLAGSDTLTIDYSGGNVSAGAIDYDGGAGAGSDSLQLVGGATTSQTFNFTNENDGSVVLAGALAGTINYLGLEPVSSTIAATNVTLNYSGATETITVSANGAQTQVDSNVGGEVVSFANPTGSLSIDGGAGDDTIAVNSFGAGFNAALLIDGGANTDSITLNSALLLGSGASTGDVDFIAEVININQPISTAAGTIGDVTFSAATQLTIAAGANILANGDVRSIGAGAVSTGGSVTTTNTLGTQNDVSFATAVTLIGDVSINTSAANGNVTFGSTLDDDAAVSDRNLIIAAGGGSPVFSDAVGAVMPPASVTVNSAENVLFSSTVATSGNLTQGAGTGTTTFNGTSGAGIGGILNLVTDAITFNAADFTTAGAITLNAQNSIVQNGNIFAGNSTISFLVNQDGVGGEDFLQAAELSTNNTSLLAIIISVGGTSGSGADAIIYGLFPGPGARVTVSVTGGAIVDQANDSAAEIAERGTGSAGPVGQVVLTAADGIGTLANPFDINTLNADLVNTTSGGIFLIDFSGGLVLTNLVGANAIDNGVGGAAVAGGGFVRANSPLTISADAITSGGITYTASDVAAAGDDLLITGAGTDVQDTTAGLTLNAGDNLTIATGTTVNAATTLTLNADTGGAVDALGALVTLNGTVTAGTSPIAVNGNVGADAFVIQSVSSDVENIGQNIVVNGSGGTDSLTVVDSGDVTPDGSLALPVTVTNDGPGDGTISRLIDANPARTIEFNGLEVVDLQTSNAGADVLQVTPNANVTFNLNGNSPVSVPGDTLLYDGTGTKTITGPFNGSITGAGVQPVNFTSFEDVRATGVNLLNDVIDLTALTGGQDGNANQVVLRRDVTGVFLEILIDTNTTDNGGVPNPVLYSRQLYSSIGTLLVTGGFDVDTLVVDNSNGLINRVISFNGNNPNVANNGGGDALSITGTPLGGLGANARETYLVGVTEDAGVWIIDPDGSRGAGASIAGNGDEMVVNFTGLEPADSDTAVAFFDVIYDAAGDNDEAEVTSDTLNGNASLRVTDLFGTFETFEFANKTNVRLMGNSGADVFNLNFATPALGLNTLEVYGHVAADVLGQPGDDAAQDVVILAATGAIATSLFGNQGNDEFLADGGGFGDFTLDDLLGTITISGQAGLDRIYLDGQLNAAAINGTLTATQLSGATGGAFNYDTVESFYLATTAAFNDTVDVLSTALGTSYLLNGSGGSDTFTIGNQTADFNANVFDGSLTPILGNVTIGPDLDLAQGIDTLNVDASGDATLAGVAAIDNIGNTAFIAITVFGGLTQSGNTTRLSNFASANINYFHSDIGFPGNAPSRLEFLNVRASTGNDVINVNATTATDTTTIDAREGNDLITIAGDALSANNVFQGFSGTDQTTLNIANHIGQNAFAPIQSVTIEGNAASDSVNRDRLTINDNSGNARQLDYLYLNSQGDLNIAANGAGNGLFGANLANGVLEVRTTETLQFFANGPTNDVVRVFGATDDGTIGGANPVNDIITVGLLDNDSSAVIFKDGAPYLTTAPATLANSRPGLAGGGLATDLLITGLRPDDGLTLNGNGNTGVAGTGDRAVVQARSELALVDVGNITNIFGFGAGVLQPGNGVGLAYDTINVTESQVTTVNVADGALTTVNLNVASFVQSGPAVVTQDAALIVNGGDELAPALNGIADNITATTSLNYNIQVNGNLPDPVTFDIDGLPLGDQLNIVGPGSVNIFSDKAAPPHVTTTFGNSIFGVVNTSIERLVLTPSNGVVNLIGDNNDAAVDQDDNFVVRGRDIDAGGSLDGGIGEMFLYINGSNPILLNGVQTLNAFGFDMAGQNLNNPDVNAPDNGAGGIDTLDIAAWADNSPRSWGVHVNFNEGEPTGIDGAQADLLIYNTVFVNPVSETIIVAPSGTEDGELQVTNAAFGTPIVTINYVNNLDIIVDDNDGFLSDTDTLTLRGTDPGTPNTSGDETFNINLQAAGDVANPLVDVLDSQSGDSLYRVRNFIGFDTLTVEMLNGTDDAVFQGRDDGTVSLVVDGGSDTFLDSLTFVGTIDDDDLLEVGLGPTNDTALAFFTRSTSGDNTRANLSRVDVIQLDGGGGTGTDEVDTYGSDAANQVTVQPFDALSGSVSVDSFPVVNYFNLGTGAGGVFSAVVLLSDNFIDGSLDSIQFVGTTLADIYTYTPTSATAGDLLLESGGDSINFSFLNFGSAAVDASTPTGGAPADELNVAVVNGVITPGATSNSGVVTATDLGGQGLLPLSYANVENTVLTGNTIVVTGTEQNDTITVTGNGLVTVTNAGGVVVQNYDLSGAAAIIVNSLGGDDTVNISGTFAGPITVIGGANGNGSDSLNVSGADAVVDLATSNVTGIIGGPISFTGIEHLNVTATATITVNGQATSDTITITPTGANTTTIVPGSSGLLDITTNNPGTLTINGAGGADSVLINATSVADTINVTKGATTTVQVGALKLISLPAATVETVTLLGGTGNDVFNISGTTINGQILNIDAGSPTSNSGAASDTLNIALTTAGTTAVAPGATPDAGVINSPDGATNFVGVEFINLTGTAGANSLNAQGTQNDDTLALQFLGGANRIWINDRAVISFVNYQTVNLNGLFGNDSFSVSPVGLLGVTTVNVSGGDPTASDSLVINGTVGSDAVNVSTLSADAATVTGMGGVVINVSTTEHLTYNGLGGVDGVTYTTPATIDAVTLTPGVSSDSAVITARANIFGSVAPVLLGMNYTNLGTGSILSIADVGGIQNDVFELNGTANDDVFNMTQTTVQVFATPFFGAFARTLPINIPGVALPTLRGLDGDDTFNVAGGVAFVSGEVHIEGGDPSASDVLNFTGAGAQVVVNLGASTITELGFSTIVFAGVETVNANTNGGNLAILGTGGHDAMSVTATGVNSVTTRLTSSTPSLGSSPVVNGTNIGNFTVDGLGGTDVVTVNGTTTADTIDVDRTLATVQVNGLEVINILSSAIVVASGLGDDTINVTGNGAAGLTIDGGQPAASDTLNLTASVVNVNFGTNPTSGTLNDISFVGIEAIGLTGDGAGSLTVNGSNGNDAITQNGNLITVNNGATVGFDDYPDVILNASSGNDTINVHPATLAGVATLTINGGDPTASDTVVVNGTAGSDNIIYTPLNLNAGTVEVNGQITNFTGTEHLTTNGLSNFTGDTLTVNTSNIDGTQVLTAGSTFDSGSVAFLTGGFNTAQAVPLAFANLGTGGSLTFDDSIATRFDSVVYLGTGGNDTFAVSAGGVVQLNSQIPVNTPSTITLTLDGRDGDDTFNIAGNHNLPEIVLLGGNPSASDVLNFIGSGTAVTVDLAAGAIAETGFGSVLYSGIEIANVDANGGNLTLLGTAGEDVLAVSPTGADTATAQLLSTSPSIGSAPIINGLDIGILSVDLLGGGDQLIVNATASAETITVDGTQVAVGAFESVNYANTEDLRVAGQGGSDTFNVTPALNTAIFIDGGDPIGATPGDQLNLFPPAAFVIEAGPETDEGGLRGVNMQRVSWDHIEGISLSGPGAAKIVGTNGDDDITIVARDASTHAGADGVQDFTVSINGGISILFLNQPTLLVDALAGDDDIVVRAPAPNNAAWNVALTIAGGTPAAATGDQGDVLEYETPGQQTITYAPGLIPGTGVLNDTTLGTTITIAQFVCPVDGVLSSQGSIEHLILDGEGGNDSVTVLGTAAADAITVSHSTALDSGAVSVNNLLGLSYEDLGAGATLAIDGLGGADTLIVDGTSNDDVFGVLANGNVAVTGHLTIVRTDYEAVTLRGQDGDDVFNINGGATLATIAIEGGNPSASDTVNYTATAGAATTVELGALTITQANPVGAIVALGGIEHVNLTSSGAGSTLTVNGTANNDTIDVSPTAAGAGSFVRTGLGTTPSFNYSGVAGAFTVTGGSGGFDILGILGDDAADTVTSTATTVTVKGGTVTLGASLEYLNINTLGGNDTVTLTGLAIPKTVDGGDGDDFIDLSAAVDALILGGAGNDILIGSPVADLIYGGSGNDILIGGGGIDEEYGEDGNDQFGDLSLAGNGVANDTGADNLFGGDGIDTFIWEPGDGSDVINGGDAGTDVLRFFGDAGANNLILSSNAGNPTRLNLNLGAATVDTSGIENVFVIAAAGADSVTVGDLTTTEISALNIDLGVGDADTVIVNGRNTADSLVASSVAAGLVGIQGLGYDINLSTATTADTLTINGNEGDDSIKVNVGVENTIGIILNGNDGNDFLSADATINGGNGNDTIQGGAGPDFLNGDAGDDTFLFSAGAGIDTIDGGTGFDVYLVAANGQGNVINVSETAVTLDGGTENLALSNLEFFQINAGGGNDTVTVSLTTIVGNIDAGSGDDLVNATGAAVSLTISGGDGNDSLTGGAGADLISGGLGNDTLIGGAGVDHQYGDGGNDRFGDASLTGNGVADDPGADFLFGGDGIDQFVWEPGDGSDVVQGGDDAADILRFIGSAAADVFSLGANVGAPTHFNLTLGAATVDTHGVEQVILLAGAGADSITVGDLTTTEIGVVNIDLGAGDADSVTFNGRNTPDNLSVTSPAAGSVGVLGLGYDVNVTNAAVADTLIVNGNEGDDTIKANVGVENTIGIVFNGNDGNDFLSADAVLNGGNGDDTLEGGAGADTINGDAGNDTILFNAGSGVDTIDGGTGFDVFVITANGSNNTISVSETAVTVDGGTENLIVNNLELFRIDALGGNDSITVSVATVPAHIDAGTGDDTVTGTGSAAALFIVGGDGNDTLIGGSANDEIYGGSGNDVLIGGAGIDHEYGEAGNDRFGDLSLNGNAVADDAGADFLFGADGVDTFIWEPGDGSDLIQGGDDLGDVLRFLGSAAANAFLLSSSANDPTHFNLNLGAATVDSTGIEQVVVNAQAGADAVTIGDLTTTEVKAVNVDLGAGDADSITVNGRNVSDDIGVSSPAAGSVGVQGLSYTLGITNAAQADTLIVNGNEGDDTIKANVGVENTVTIVFNGNDGDDLLSADATLNGGNGDDILIGGLGADNLNGGDGDDLLTGNGGVDAFDGGAGYDTIVEARNANFTLTDTTLLIGAEGIDTVASMENALLTGGIGANTFVIGAFTGDTTVTGTGGSDTVDFSTATQGIHIDLDAKNVDQIINLAGRKIVFGDIIENLNASPFDDTINVDIAQFNRLINGGLENAIPPGDRLNVDLLGSNPSSTKVPNGGKLGSFNGTVNGSGFTGTITYQDIETLVIKGANSTPPDFSSATQYDVGDGPRGVITADVNGDGRLDMIVSNSRSNNISVRFGDGFGVFGALVNYSAGGKKAKQTTTVAVGDVDGDGDLDIVVTNRKTNNVSVLLNDGTGAFGTATLYDTGIKQSGKFPTSVKFGDMNNDGNIDIVTANANVRKNGSISILTGDGAGGFGAPNVTQTLGRRPRDLVLIDTNADGNLDVVATNLFSRNVVVLNGNGAGGLAAPVSYDVGVTPNSIISGDFNGDGILDVATTSLVSPRISILIGTGAAAGAAFLPVKDIKYPAVHLDISITTADIDGDGNLDLLLANRNDNTLSYLLGNGNGTFDNPVEFKTGNTLFREPVSIAVGDFNNDGAIDIMIANAGSDDVSVLIHDPIV